MASRLLILAALALISTAARIDALRFYVNPTTGDNRRHHLVAQDSSTPWRTITHALQMAHLINQDKPHVIDIAGGTYAPSTGETFPFVVTKPDIYFRSQGNVILDAQRQSRILQITAPSSEFVLRNFSLVNGVAERGGAVSCESCTLRVVNSRLIGNESTAGGDAIYVADGRLQMSNNIVRQNGASGSAGPIVEVRNTFADTSKRDVIRNNTFYQNLAATIKTTGNRTDISSNIFVGQSAGVPAIVDSVSGLEPLVRYNLFWATDILYLSGDRDSIKVARTVRDTTSLAEQGVDVPSFVTNVPDTVAQVGSLYEFDIEVEGSKSSYSFLVPNTNDLPTGMSTELARQGVLSWTPTADQVGQNSVRLEINDGSPPAQFLSYVIRVFTAEDFPDTTTPAPIITVSMAPDTSGAIDSLNSIIPVFSSSASARGNVYGDPLFQNPEISRFELLTSKTVTVAGTLKTINSVARDAGNPIAAMNDAVTSGGQVRNDMGFTGGPTTNGPPTPTTSTATKITNLPDSLAVEGQAWVYDPDLDPDASIILIDVIQGTTPGTMSGAFGKKPPISWTPALSDTGTYLVGVETFTPASVKHYFPLRVRAANARPRILSTPPTAAAEDAELSYAIDAVDDDGHSLSYSVQSGPAGLTVDSLGVVRWTPDQAAADAGSVDVVILITDSGGATNTQAFTLTVTNTNDAPVLTAPADTTITEDVPFTLSLSITDSDPADSTFTWSLVDGPDSVAVDSAGHLSWTPRQADVGVDTLTVRAADAAGAADSVSFAVTVLEVDDPPFITSSPDTLAPEDAPYEYAAQASDEEGAPLTFTLTAAPTGMTVDTLGVVRWTPAVADTGSHPVTLQAADPGGQTAAQTWQLRVTEVNDPPVILSRDPADSLVLLDPGQAVTFSLDLEDEEGDQLTVRWFVDGTQQSTSSTFLLAPDSTSADTVVARVSDGADSTETQWIVDARAIAKITVSTDTLDFGRVTLGDTARITRRVGNPGRTTLSISNLQLGDLAFQASFGASQIVKGDSTTLTVSFIAASRGGRSGSVQFSTNDPDRETVTIPVTAVAAVPTTAALDADPATGDQAARTGIARIGDSVSLDVEAVDALQVESYTVELAWDPAVLTFASFDASGGLLGSGTATQVGTPTDGSITVSASADTSVSGDGRLGRVTLDVAAGAQAGTSTAVGLSRVTLTSVGQATADTLADLEGVVLQVANAQPGDVSGDGIVDFDDFFLFADDFGTSAARSDFNGDGTVDFDDFFLFADFFGAGAARPVPVAGEAAAGLLLASGPAASTGTVEVELLWQGEAPLRGAGLWLGYDPRQLTFDQLLSPGEGPTVLSWSRSDADGRVELALAPTAGAAFDGALGRVRFTRQSPEATAIRVHGALGRTGSEVTPRALAAPAALRVAALPATAVLFPAHPNPFNPETVIPFFVPDGAGTVRLRVYDLLGRPVTTLTEGSLAGGHHRFVWRGRDDQGRQAGAGVYLVELRTAHRRQIRKVMLLK